MSATQEVLAKAYSMLGVRYVLGAESDTQCDCSGLVYRAFSATGHADLIGGTRRLAAGYAHYFASRGAYSNDINDAQPGDLITYTHGSTHISHIGIYVGNYRVISALTTTGVTETRYDRISVDFAGVCLVPFTGARVGLGTVGGNDSDGEDGVDPTDTSFNNQVEEKNADVQEGLGVVESALGDWLLPVRRVHITFPTPTDARFEYTLSEMYDQAFIITDPPYVPGDIIPPEEPGFPDIDPWITEHIPTDPFGTVGPSTSYIDSTFGTVEEWFVRDGPVIPNVQWVAPNPGGYILTGESHGGRESGPSLGINDIYSAVGISSGFLANIPWYASDCGIGYGGFIGGETKEMWFQLGLVQGLPQDGSVTVGELAYEITWNELSLSGVASGMTVRIVIQPDDWHPGPEDGFI